MLKNGHIKADALSPRLSAPSPRRVRQAFLITGALAMAAALTACGGSSSPSRELAQDKQILATCNVSAPPATDIQIDGTGSSAAQNITNERMTAIQAIVRETAICSGRLRVSVFSSSSAATTTLLDEPLSPYGATDNARLKRVGAMVDDTMTQIRNAYGPAVAALPGGGSDITAQYRLASEWIRQVGGNFRLHLFMLTDGFQNIGIHLDTGPLSKDELAELADDTAMPKLPNASVVVAGLGRVVGAPPRSDVVEGLVDYYNALCHKSGAAKCVSVTDYAYEGR
ncbi:hypothetical protein EDD99_5167 [Streptomyces sp. 846.5]|nr:hypothetical protein [Streptomyces sp. 846.5]TDU06604.1 hypothetical protein EDD99_5167 [Streptomyces sp. 846.5]